MVSGTSRFSSPSRGGGVALLLCLAAAVIGCTGKKVPSYKDRIGTIDPATAPIDVPPVAD
jgi:hypothetical protein